MMVDIKDLERRIDAVFRSHCEKDNGMIVGPERLLNGVMLTIVLWLKEDIKESLAILEKR